MSKHVTRRGFLGTATAAGIGLTIRGAGAAEKPAALGGKPVRTAKFPEWPVWDNSDEEALVRVIRSGKWNRNTEVAKFEEMYAQMTGAKHCLATANGTAALLTSLAALGVKAGDEVILPPYTFVATVNVILALNALPVFVDSDLATSQIDAGKIEAAITERTKAIMPVHLGGNVADMDRILALAKKHSLPVVEDTCQSHLAEWKSRKAGTLGATGCFSFQATKNLNSGEGGAILSDDEDLVEKCYAFHNNSRGRKATGYTFIYAAPGLNMRMTEFQGALLVAQMKRLEKQASTREQNAQYLTKLLGAIPGVTPARMYEGCTRNAYHLYMFRYNSEGFAGLPRDKFLKALSAEGIPCSSGYKKLNKEEFIAKTVHSPAYQSLFSSARLAQWEQRNELPENDKLTAEAVWFTQPMLLGPRSDMDQIAEAIGKIHANAAQVAKA